MRGFCCAVFLAGLVTVSACASGPGERFVVAKASVSPAELEGLSPPQVLARLGAKSDVSFGLRGIELIDNQPAILLSQFNVVSPETCPPVGDGGKPGAFGVTGPSRHMVFINDAFSAITVSAERVIARRAGEPYVGACTYIGPRPIRMPNSFELVETVVMTPFVVGVGGAILAGQVLAAPLNRSEWARRAQVLATLRLGQPLPGGTDAFLRAQSRGTIESDSFRDGRRSIVFALDNTNQPGGGNRAYLELRDDVLVMLLAPSFNIDGKPCRLGAGPSVVCY